MSSVPEYLHLFREYDLNSCLIFLIMLQYPDIFNTRTSSPLLRVWTEFIPYIACHASIPWYLLYRISSPLLKVWTGSIPHIPYCTLISPIPGYLPSIKIMTWIHSLYIWSCFSTRISSIPGYLQLYWKYELDSFLIFLSMHSTRIFSIPGYLHLYWKYELDLFCILLSMLEYQDISNTRISSPLLKIWPGFIPYIPYHASVPGYLLYPDIFISAESMNWIYSYSPNHASVTGYLQYPDIVTSTEIIN